jgi:2-(1,2-epoxy-1,2-dihydrophenyl)acetyl-CoA isomerase
MSVRETVLLDVADGIGVLTFNRPEVLNAHNYKMRVEVQEAADEALRDDKVRVLVVTGAGRGFHAGDDGKDRVEGGLEALKRDRQAAVVGRLDPGAWTGQPNPRYFFGYPKPTIAAVNGAAVGAGLAIALSCDVRLASEKAKFGYLFTRRGLMGPSLGLTALAHIVGLSRTMELALSGELIDAAEADRIGLVSRVVGPEALLDEAKTLAAKLMKGAPLAQRAVKESLYRSLFDSPGLEDFNARRDAALTESEDHREGFAAFAEKRDPTWRGR